MNPFVLTVISFFALLAIASMAAILAKRVRLPYTVFLFVIGFAVVFLQSHVPGLELLGNIHLSKDLVFFIFLPTLIFESAYNIPYKKLLRDIMPLTGLAVFSLIISTFVIGLFLNFILGLIGINIPLSICLLFGSIISATDPVAVLSIFKDSGAPKRLIYLFEGESLLNDGTGLALFLVILASIVGGRAFGWDMALEGGLTFLSMILGGLLFGLLMGYLFSRAIKVVRHSWAELTLTLLMPHSTFMAAELISESFPLKISAIIATAVASLVLGNYGRYKISSEVRGMIDITWGYMAFIANSLVFLLMGFLIGDVDFQLSVMLIPIAVSIVVVAVARMFSVYAVMEPLNHFMEHPIPRDWSHLLGWASLRGVIAIVMLLFVPEDLTVPRWTLELSPHEFLTIMVISCIVFTLIVKASSLGFFVRKMRLNAFSKEEEFTLHQVIDLIDRRVLKDLTQSSKDKYIHDDVIRSLKERYKKELSRETEEIRLCKMDEASLLHMVRRYALGIERHTAIEMYEASEMAEHTLKILLNKIEGQFIRLEANLPQLKTGKEKKKVKFRLREWIKGLRGKERTISEKYVISRSRLRISHEVIMRLEQIKQDFDLEKKHLLTFQKVIDQYKHWNNEAQKAIDELHKKHGDFLNAEEYKLKHRHLVYLQEDLLKKLLGERVINSRLYHHIRRKLR